MGVIESVGRNGLELVRVAHRSGSSAEVYLNGAHVTSWIVEGEEKLFLATAAKFEKGESIRGGIPVVFPQFASEGTLPQHGFARKSQWSVIDNNDGDDVSAVTLRMSDDSVTRAIWPHSFQLDLTVAVAASSLRVTLGAENTDERAFEFTCALHTYLHVSDIERASVIGLCGTEYIDKTRANSRVRDTAAKLAALEETDRVYLDAPKNVMLEDAAAGKSLRIESSGFSDAVVWNPGRHKSATFSGMGAEDYRRMICIEAAQVGRPITLAAGAAWTGAQMLTTL